MIYFFLKIKSILKNLKIDPIKLAVYSNSILAIFEYILNKERLYATTSQTIVNSIKAETLILRKLSYKNNKNLNLYLSFVEKILRKAEVYKISK